MILAATLALTPVVLSSPRNDADRAARAVEIATRRTPGFVLELTPGGGDRRMWSVYIRGRDGRVVEKYVNLEQGRITETERVDDQEKTSMRPPARAISVVKAVERALREAPGRLRTAELERRGTRHVWWIQVDREGRAGVSSLAFDAVTGRPVSPM